MGEEGGELAGWGVVWERWERGRADAGAFEDDEEEDVRAVEEDAGGGAEET